MPCSNCGEDKRIVARGLCSACYSRLHRKGTVERSVAVNKGRMCSVDGCDRPAVAKGMCFPHYQANDHPLKTVWKNIRSRHPQGFPLPWSRFDAFLADVGERPSNKHQLRRLDPTLPFSKENVVWLAPVDGDRRSGWSVEERAEYMREWNFRKSYGMSVEDYDEMLKKQEGRCAICSRNSDEIIGRNILVVDHDHAKGVSRKGATKASVRGLLCVPCNRGLGYFADDLAILRRAITYLELHANHVEAVNG